LAEAATDAEDGATEAEEIVGWEEEAEEAAEAVEPSEEETDPEGADADLEGVVATEVEWLERPVAWEAEGLHTTLLLPGLQTTPARFPE
jgi:hypothetical protein